MSEWEKANAAEGNGGGLARGNERVVSFVCGRFGVSRLQQESTLVVATGAGALL